MRVDPGNLPLVLDIKVCRRSDDLEVKLVSEEEVMLSEEGGPLSLPSDDFVDDLGTYGSEHIDSSSCSTAALPLLNSSVMMCCVEAITLWVAHIDGYAGVIMGMRWFRSCGYSCRICQNQGHSL